MEWIGSFLFEAVRSGLHNQGGHAQRAIPRLEKVIHYFENEEQDFPKQMSLKKTEQVRETIAEIRAMTEKPELVELKR